MREGCNCLGRPCIHSRRIVNHTTVASNASVITMFQRHLQNAKCMVTFAYSRKHTQTRANAYACITADSLHFQLAVVWVAQLATVATTTTSIGATLSEWGTALLHFQTPRTEEAV